MDALVPDSLASRYCEFLSSGEFQPAEKFTSVGSNARAENSRRAPTLCLFDRAQEIGGEMRRQEESELPATCHPLRKGMGRRDGSKMTQRGVEENTNH